MTRIFVTCALFTASIFFVGYGPIVWGEPEGIESSTPERIKQLPPNEAPTADSAKVHSPKPEEPTKELNNTVRQKQLGNQSGKPRTRPKVSGPLSDYEVGRYQFCADDRECVVATNGCCDCNGGGNDVAINRDRMEDFRKRFECNRVSCPIRPSGVECRTGVVSCVNHRCRYFNDIQYEAVGGELTR